MEDRMTLCNMVVEGGGKNGIVPADQTTIRYLEVSSPASPWFLEKLYIFSLKQLSNLQWLDGLKFIINMHIACRTKLASCMSPSEAMEMQGTYSESYCR